MAITPISNVGNVQLGSMPGIGSMPGGGGGGLGQLPGSEGDPATQQGQPTFGDVMRSTVFEKPSVAQANADNLAERFAAGDSSVDPHQLAIATAKAGVEIQMATRTISQAVSAVRTLFQMQI